MLNRYRRLSAGMITLLLGLGAGGMVVQAGQNSSDEGPIRCEISATTKGQMTTLQGVVHTDEAVEGTYLFSVKSVSKSGSSSSQQGGEFVAGSNDTVTVGNVTMGGNGISYDVKLKVMANGMTIECAELIGDQKV